MWNDDWIPASKPPSDDRTVVVELKNGGTGLGYCSKGEWKLVTGTLVNVISWCDRPGYTGPKSKKGTR